MKCYVISGMAADRRVFNHLQFPHTVEPVFLEWITPQQTETLPAYAKRLALKIDAQKPFMLLGLSMGGMIAVEIAKLMQPSATILLSSIPLSSQLPNFYKLAGKLQLYKMVPVGLIKKASLVKRFFASESAEDKQTLRNVVIESDAAFIRWAMEAVLKWENDYLPNPYFHIHGSSDEILPMKYTRPTHIIPNGKHLMVMTRSGEVNGILREIFNQHSAKAGDGME